MPKIDRQAIYERDRGLCGFCCEPVAFELMHLDHIEPKGLGGPTTAENLRVAHRRCNIAAGHAVSHERKVRGIKRESWEMRVTRPTIPGTVYNALVAASDSEDRTLNAQIVRVLREWAEKQPEP